MIETQWDKPIKPIRACCEVAAMFGQVCKDCERKPKGATRFQGAIIKGKGGTMPYLELDKETGATVLNPGRKPRVKNECLKTRTKDNPYEVWVSFDGTWEWRVLKKYQVDNNKPFARWLCAVSSPFTFGGFDIGDCYVKDIINHATRKAGA